MAGFKTHITTSCFLGGGYAALGAYYGLPIEAALVAGGLCGIGGMLPDIDSDSGVPVRETMGFAAAVTPMLLVDRFQHLGLNYEQMVLAAGASYLSVRFGFARLLKNYTVHRGMFHSIPALLIFTGVAFLLCGYGNLHLRYFKAAGVFIGVLSHLMLDEIFAVEWTGGRWRFKKSFGTALKLWGDSAWGNFSTYSKLAVVAVLVLSEPSIMERYGKLSPIVVNNAALRERLRIPNGNPNAAPMLAEGTTQPPADWATINSAFATVPTAGEPPTPNHPDRTIYDTARRIWQRLAH
ncbi:MAG: metal-dependent hydrolase [Pirellulales bacterium]|nr:metal-dependent hydrolase [Pirellulales bacterium]